MVPKVSSAPIWRGRWPGNVVRRPRASWSSVATAPACRRWRARCRSSRLISRCSSFRPGTACPTTGSRRMTALSRLAHLKGHERASVLLTTINAALQRVPAKSLVATQSLSAVPGQIIDMAGITGWLELNGFARASTVREAGDYAVRGGIIDLFAPGMAEPVRLDFFGDTLETIRTFDPETQRTTDQLHALNLVPVSEFQLTSETIRRFRLGYVAAFGAPGPDDVL